MSTREMQLISRIVRSGDLNSVLEWGVTQDDFLTNEGRAMFNHILGYYARRDTEGSVIGENAVKEVYPTFILCDDPSMTTPALCTEVRKGRSRIDLEIHAKKILELAENDPYTAAAYGQNVMSEVLNLGTSKDVDVYFSNELDNIISKYEQKEQGVDFSCGLWPWEPLNEATGGIQPDDYVVLYGRPKSMKSWVLAALIAWAYNCQKKVVIYTKEMTPENIFMRVAACIGQLDYHSLRMAKLTKQEKESLYAVREMVQQLKHDQNLVCLRATDAPGGGDTVPWLQSKVEKHNPDLVCIDGMYLMSDVKKARKDHERVMNISRALRGLVLSTNVPVVATVQANRGAAAHGKGNLDEIAYSDAIGQDATIAMRVINDKGAPTISLVMAGSREFELPGFRIYGIPATNFSDHSLLTEKEITKAKEKDTVDEDNPSAHVKTGARKKKRVTESKSLIAAKKRLEKMM